MSYRIAGIDVHKKKLAVVAANLKLGEEVQFERRWYGSTPEQLRALAEWFVEQQVEEVVILPKRLLSRMPRPPFQPAYEDS